MEDALNLFEQQIEKLVEAVVKLKTEKKKLLETNESLQKQIKDLQGQLEATRQENEELKQTGGGGEAKERLDSLLSRINEALGE